MEIDLDSVVCPGCAVQLPLNNTGCKHCGYEDNDRGRILPLGSLAQLPSYPVKGSASFNGVSPKFFAVLIQAAQTSAASTNHGDFA